MEEQKSNEHHITYKLGSRRIKLVDDYLKTYMDNDKLIEATAVATKASEKEVKYAVDFVFKNLRYWLDNPRIKGSFVINSWIYFTIDAHKTYKQLERYIHIYRKLKEEGKPYAPYGLRKFEVLRKRHGLAREYDKHSREQGLARNAGKLVEKRNRQQKRILKQKQK